MNNGSRKPVSELFWAKVDKAQIGTGCWFWTGSTTAGYGLFTTGSRVAGYTKHGAHRFAYELVVGPIPQGLHLDHLCRNTHCVNPAHLEPVTPGENVRRGMSGGNRRDKTHCVHGHEFTPENTIMRTSNGVRPGYQLRACRQCYQAFRRTYRARKRAA